MIEASEPLLGGEEGAGVGGADQRAASSTSASDSSSSSSSRASEKISDEEDNSVYIKFDPYRVESVDDSLLRERNRKPSVVYELKEKGREMCLSRGFRFTARPLLVSLAVLVLFTTLVVIAVHGARRHDNTRSNINGDPGNSMRADAPPVSLTSRGAWYYPRGESKESVSSTIQQLGLDFVVVSAGAHNLDDPEEFQSAVDLFKEIQSVGVRPIAMTLQGPNFAYMSNLQMSLDLVDSTLRLCNAIETCNEIHLDIEPHTLDAWKSGSDEEKQAILDEMTTVIKAVNERVRSQTNGEVTVTTAVTWWMLSNPVLKLQFDSDVKIYIMAYGGVGGSADDILRMVSKKDSLGLRGEQYYVGIGITEFEDKVKGALNAAQIVEQSIQEPLFGGVCFYSLNFATGEDD